MFDLRYRGSKTSPESSGRALSSYYNGAGPSLAKNRDECRRSEPGIGSDRSRNERAATLPRISVRRVGRAKSARFTGAGEGELGTAALIFIRVEPRRWSWTDAVDAEECLHNGTKTNMRGSALAELLLRAGPSDHPARAQT